MAAAFCLTPQVLASAPSADAAVLPDVAVQHVTSTQLGNANPQHADLLSAARAATLISPSTRLTAATRLMAGAVSQSTAKTATTAKTGTTAKTTARSAPKPTSYTVQSGDTLTSIAEHFYKSSDAWPAIYYANRGQVHWADIIQPGQVLSIPAEPARIPGAPSQLTPAVSAPAATAQAAPESSAYTPTATSAQDTATTQQASSDSGGGYPGGSFGACVVERESGGDSQVMNSSGHYGLYQFSESTWVAYGGSAADFGDASVAEQDQVFATALSEGGESNWSAYDGC
jgi:LysM repeat protein